MDPTQTESDDSRPSTLPQDTNFTGVEVLVVEDNRVNQIVAEGLLKHAGIQVQCAQHGAEAVAAVIRRRFDAVLMDLTMPVMDGFRAAAEIRRHPHGTDLPILAMTASTLKEDHERCLAAGIDDYIPKPIRAAELYAKLRRWIKRSDGSGGHPAPPTMPRDQELPPDLPGLDQTSGLYHANGDRQLYGTLLRQFREQYRQTWPELRAALATGDLVNAARTVHTLKGVAGSLGAARLCETATALDAAFKAHDLANVATLIDGRLQEDLEELLAGLNGLAEVVVTQPSEPLDSTAFAPHLQELHNLLKVGDFRAIEYFSDLRPYLEGCVSAPALTELERQIRHCELRQALGTLLKLLPREKGV